MSDRGSPVVAAELGLTHAKMLAIPASCMGTGKQGIVWSVPTAASMTFTPFVELQPNWIRVHRVSHECVNSKGVPVHRVVRVPAPPCMHLAEPDIPDAVLQD